MKMVQGMFGSNGLGQSGLNLGLLGGLIKGSGPKMSADQAAAIAAQQRAGYAAQEGNARNLAEKAASGRLLRGAGRSSLAFGGAQGLASTLGGG